MADPAAVARALERLAAGEVAPAAQVTASSEVATAAGDTEAPEATAAAGDTEAPEATATAEAAAVVERAAWAVADRRRALRFRESDDPGRLRSAVATLERAGNRRLARRGQRALAAFEWYERACAGAEIDVACQDVDGAGTDVDAAGTVPAVGGATGGVTARIRPNETGVDGPRDRGERPRGDGHGRAGGVHFRRGRGTHMRDAGEATDG